MKMLPLMPLRGQLEIIQVGRFQDCFPRLNATKGLCCLQISLPHHTLPITVQIQSPVSESGVSL